VTMVDLIVIARPALPGEVKIDNTAPDPKPALARILELLRSKGAPDVAGA